MPKKRYLKVYCLIVLCILISIVYTVRSYNILNKDVIGAFGKQSSVKYVFYFIGDGMGSNQKLISQYYKQHIESDDTAKLLMNDLPITSLVTTQSADSLISDSAASATALATGKKTNNRVISIGPDGKTPYKTLLEAAEKKGMATGLISDVSIVDATPASFAAHVKSRKMKDEIAVQYLYKGIEYIAGGGAQSFIPQSETGSTRRDNRNLLKEFKAKGYTIINTREELYDMDLNSIDKVLGLFSLSYFPMDIDRQNEQGSNKPSLAEMLVAGIKVLSKEKEGFFVVVEGGKIDYAGHSSDLPALVYEVFGLDEAIQVAFKFYEQHPKETLIVVAADHETGGLTLGLEKKDINLDAIDGVTASVFGEIYPRYQNNPDDIKGLVEYIEKVYDIKLSKGEKVKLTRELSQISSKKYDNKFEKLGDFGSAISQIISKMTNIGWCSSWHTADAVPVTAIGMKSELFVGNKDNTDIAKSIAKAVGLNLEESFK
ncbi:alkaline phosphatase [Wukongibacter baidiensis]|uniref:alkaline phosphatase n=1 Tax=Wukongibacter baidiensis TaxID=1723361 RepID=UPI003D7F21BA